MNSLLAQLCSLTLKSTVRHRVAAGLFTKKKGFMSTGYNCNRTYLSHTLMQCFHAEHAAIHHFQTRYRKKCPPNLMVVRTGYNGTLLSSRPCIHCCQHIASAGIRKVYYINEEQQLVCERIQQLLDFRQKEPALSNTDIWFNSIQPTSMINDVIDQQYHTHHRVFTKEMGIIITSLRQQYKWTQMELAERASISLLVVQTIEEKGTHPYTLGLVSKLKRALGSFTWNI